ncbi:DUF3530 family protein [Zooshikella marina]|uniref:DUF3530 family protein n=1 Tax=Zooshikella ganghwensis TaxID=202772 RepID=UPI001BB02C8C|nr:DUF3530 family protein [Zooshikella ganghwensis]MBU2708035.1 DUF3530 family protein [Zooshikella ganghwensis]
MRHNDSIILCIIILLICCLPVRAAQEGNAANQPSGSESKEQNTLAESTSSTAQESTTPTKQDRVLASDFISRSQQALQQLYTSDQLVTLNLEKDSAYGLWQDERSGSLKGTVILLAEQGNHADWPKYMHKLRQQLPLRGWSTLAITPPSPSIAIMEAKKTSSADAQTNNVNAQAGQEKENQMSNNNKKTNPTDNEKQQNTPNNSQPKPDNKDDNVNPNSQKAEFDKHLPVFQVTPSMQAKYSDTVNELMKSAHQFAQEKTTDKVFLLAIGSSCSFLLSQLAKHPNDYTGIILIDCKPNNWSPTSTSIEPLDKQKIPVLDLEVKRTPHYSRWAQLRKAASLKAENPSYRQRLLISVGYDKTLDKRILKYVSQWIDAVLTAIKRAEKLAEEAAALQQQNTRGPRKQKNN